MLTIIINIFALVTWWTTFKMYDAEWNVIKVIHLVLFLKTNYCNI